MIFLFLVDDRELAANTDVVLLMSIILPKLFCSALEPSSLQRAVYPVLTSYSTPDQQAYPSHSLSRAALITSGSPIFFLDAFTTLIVFYSSTADPTLPYPPPHDCKYTLFIVAFLFKRCFVKIVGLHI